MINKEKTEKQKQLTYDQAILKTENILKQKNKDTRIKIFAIHKLISGLYPFTMKHNYYYNINTGEASLLDK